MKDVRTPDQAVEKAPAVEIEIKEELKLAQEDGTTVVLEAGDKVKVLREGQLTPNEWEYVARDEGMSGYPTLTLDLGGQVGGNPGNYATVTYIPEDRGFQFMPTEEGGDYTDHRSAHGLLKEARKQRVPLSAEDLIYFL